MINYRIRRLRQLILSGYIIDFTGQFFPDISEILQDNHQCPTAISINGVSKHFGWVIYLSTERRYTKILINVKRIKIKKTLSFLICISVYYILKILMVLLRSASYVKFHWFHTQNSIYKTASIFIFSTAPLNESFPLICHDQSLETKVSKINSYSRTLTSLGLLSSWLILGIFICFGTP